MVKIQTLLKKQWFAFWKGGIGFGVCSFLSQINYNWISLNFNIICLSVLPLFGIYDSKFYVEKIFAQPIPIWDIKVYYIWQELIINVVSVAGFHEEV